MANPSFSGVTSVLISQILFDRLPEEDKQRLKNTRKSIKKIFRIYNEDGKYFEDLAKDLDGDHISFEFLDLEEYGTLY